MVFVLCFSDGYAFSQEEHGVLTQVSPNPIFSINFSFNPFNPKYLEWYSPSLDHAGTYHTGL